MACNRHRQSFFFEQQKGESLDSVAPSCLHRLSRFRDRFEVNEIQFHFHIDAKNTN